MHRAPASPQSRTHWIEGLRGKTNSYIMPADQEGIFPVHLTLLLTHSSFSENSWDAEHFLPTLSRACPCSGHSPWKAKPSLSPPSSSYPPYLLRYFCLELFHQTAFLLSLLTIHTQLKGKSSTSSNCRKAPAFQGRETCAVQGSQAKLNVNIAISLVMTWLNNNNNKKTILTLMQLLKICWIGTAFQ